MRLLKYEGKNMSEGDDRSEYVPRAEERAVGGVWVLGGLGVRAWGRVKMQPGRSRRLLCTGGYVLELLGKLLAVAPIGESEGASGGTSGGPSGASGAPPVEGVAPAASPGSSGISGARRLGSRSPAPRTHGASAASPEISWV